MAAIRKNDKVKVSSGKEKGRQGKVLKVFNEREPHWWSVSIL